MMKRQEYPSYEERLGKLGLGPGEEEENLKEISSVPINTRGEGAQRTEHFCVL